LIQGTTSRQVDNGPAWLTGESRGASAEYTRSHHGKQQVLEGHAPQSLAARDTTADARTNNATAAEKTVAADLGLR